MLAFGTQVALNLALRNSISKSASNGNSTGNSNRNNKNRLGHKQYCQELCSPAAASTGLCFAAGKLERTEAKEGKHYKCLARQLHKGCPKLCQWTRDGLAHPSESSGGLLQQDGLSAVP